MYRLKKIKYKNIIIKIARPIQSTEYECKNID